MKTIYLIPSSEGKKPWWSNIKTQTTFKFKLPIDIAKNATPIDLKCKDKKYQEAISLNHNIKKSPTAPAINRYTWVMYSAIDYHNLDDSSKQHFDDHVLIISGLYGILKPQDYISDYKLPISTKWLKEHRWEDITNSLIKYCHQQNITQIVNLLPLTHQKFINNNKLQKKNINIYIPDIKTHYEKITHQIKKVKWLWLREEIINKSK